MPVLKLKVSAFTRWLSHYNTTGVLRKRSLPLLNALQKLADSDAVAAGLYCQYSTYTFMGWLLLSREALPVLGWLLGSSAMMSGPVRPRVRSRVRVDSERKLKSESESESESDHLYVYMYVCMYVRVDLDLGHHE